MKITVTHTPRGGVAKSHDQEVNGKPASAYSTADVQSLLRQAALLHLEALSDLWTWAEVDDKTGATTFFVASKLGKTELGVFPGMNNDVVQRTLKEPNVLTAPTVPVMV